MKQNKSTKSLIILGLLILTILPPLILCAVGLPFLGVRILWNPYNDNSGITAVTGTVIDYKETTGSRNETYYYEIYECELDDDLYTVESSFPKTETSVRDIGDSVELYYYIDNDEVSDFDVTNIFFLVRSSDDSYCCFKFMDCCSF